MTRTKEESVRVVRFGGREYDLREYDSPGKFEGGLVIDEYVYSITLDGADQEAGDISEMGWWAGLLEGDLVEGVLSAIRDNDDPPLLNDERKFLDRAAGAIVEEDDQGFISVTYYATATKLNQAWENIQADEEYERDEERDYGEPEGDD